MVKRSTGGHREDLGIYVRSTWEARYCRYLKFMVAQPGSDIVSWEYEAEEFEFPGIKRGTRFYKPDFKVFFADGHIEYHEVKGYRYPKGQTALKRMAKYHPKIKIVMIEGAFFATIKSKGLHRLIPHYEED